MRAMSAPRSNTGFMRRLLARFRLRRVRLADGRTISWRQATANARRSQAERDRLMAEYKELFEQVRRILTEADPIHIALEEVNPDEYEPEVGTILPRLKDARSSDDVRRILHEEFVRWFSPEDAGPENRYEQAAVEVWQAWQRHSSR
jgi:hypothetical protein